MRGSKNKTVFPTNHYLQVPACVRNVKNNKGLSNRSLSTATTIESLSEHGHDSSSIAVEEKVQ